ncbi:hypothetical protein [Candidatus Contubernalis alkaliaceticus]|uniref:hypothetical protein n=1 Tax=Candidatus Contubernalis alkaliaceticus TaxID=338645 RepID=UPI001F4BD8C6|nr:hypothetical protein [Candidatus Contubernalis alkalaceticus]UNC93195.1 hypothetical protein HUE98_14520 [Candidatus Contubernalis alkalaceticus]
MKIARYAIIIKVKETGVFADIGEDTVFVDGSKDLTSGVDVERVDEKIKIRKMYAVLGYGGLLPCFLDRS